MRRALSDGQGRELRRLVGAYLAYQTFAAANFSWPVFMVFYRRFGGLELPAIFALQAFHSAVRVVLEAPLGLAADRFGRRRMLVASAAVAAIGFGVMISGPSLPLFYLAELCFAVSVAAKSGADSAWLYDTLAAHGQREDYPRIEGRAQSLAALAGATSALASGWLLDAWLPLPYLASLAGAAAATLAATLLDEAPGRQVAGPGVLARGALAEIAASSALRWLIALYALLLTISHVVFYLQQPYLEEVGVPVALFGVVVAVTKLVHAAIAHRAQRIEAHVEARRMPGFLLVAALAPVGIMGAVPFAFGALFVPLRGVADGLLQPVVQFYLNRLVTPLRRASILSLASLAARLLQVAMLAAVGAALAELSVATTLRLAFAVSAAAGLLLLYLGPRRGGRGRAGMEEAHRRLPGEPG